VDGRLIVVLLFLSRQSLTIRHETIRDKESIKDYVWRRKSDNYIVTIRLCGDVAEMVCCP
jgi:hypothetical protein